MRVGRPGRARVGEADAAEVDPERATADVDLGPAGHAQSDCPTLTIDGASQYAGAITNGCGLLEALLRGKRPHPALQWSEQRVRCVLERELPPVTVRLGRLTQRHNTDARRRERGERAYESRRCSTDRVTSRDDRRYARRRYVNPYVRIVRPEFRLTVEARELALDQADLEYGRLDWRGAGDEVDAVRDLKHGQHLAPVVAREVAPDTGAEVGGLPDVDDRAVRVAKQVDTGTAGEMVREVQLVRLRMTVEGGELEEVVEAEHTEPGGAFQEEVEQIGSGTHVVEGPVRRLVAEPEVSREGAELAVRDLGTHEPAGEAAGIDELIRQLRIRPGGERGVQEPEVEADVVAHDHGIADELEQRRQYPVDHGRGADHVLGDARQIDDLGWDRDAGVDEGLERPHTQPAHVLRRPHFGDSAHPRGRAGGLEVDDTERDMTQRRTEVVEGLLMRLPRLHRSARRDVLR